MANGQTKLNYEDTDAIDLDLVVSTITENDIKLHFCWLSLTMKIYIVIPIGSIRPPQLQVDRRYKIDLSVERIAWNILKLCLKS